MKPSEIYLERVKRKELSEDQAQINLLKKLDVISDNLNKKKWDLFNYTPIKGIYIFGKVGRGKTQVMDIFYQSLKTNLKDRLHFHRFMKMLHDELANLEDTIDPIYKVVKKISKKTSVLCFDEFFVEDDQLDYDQKAVSKRLQKDGVSGWLRAFRDELANFEPFQAAGLEELMKGWVAPLL